MFFEIFTTVAMVLAGCGALLVGFKLLSNNMEKLFGNALKGLFNKTSDKKLVGVGMGAATTAVVQRVTKQQQTACPIFTTLSKRVLFVQATWPTFISTIYQMLQALTPLCFQKRVTLFLQTNGISPQKNG